MPVLRRVRVMVLAGVIVVVSSSGAARAQSQTGGLPLVSDRVSALEEVAASLKTAVTTLQTQVTVLQTANTGLQNALNAEIATRAAADTALRTADADLQDAIDLETFARRAADTVTGNTVAALSSRIDGLASVGKAYEKEVRSTFLVNGALGTLAVLDGLPAGRYVVIAKALVENVDHDADWTCYLLRGDLSFPDTLDISAATTASGFIENHSNVALAAVATLPAPGSFKIQCFTLVASSTLRWVKIVAISAQ